MSHFDVRRLRPAAFGWGDRVAFTDSWRHLRHLRARPDDPADPSGDLRDTDTVDDAQRLLNLNADALVSLSRRSGRLRRVTERPPFRPRGTRGRRWCTRPVPGVGPAHSFMSGIAPSSRFQVPLSTLTTAPADRTRMWCVPSGAHLSRHLSRPGGTAANRACAWSSACALKAGQRRLRSGSAIRPARRRSHPAGSQRTLTAVRTDLTASPRQQPKARDAYPGPDTVAANPSSGDTLPMWRARIGHRADRRAAPPAGDASLRRGHAFPGDGIGCRPDRDSIAADSEGMPCDRTVLLPTAFPSRAARDVRSLAATKKRPAAIACTRAQARCTAPARWHALRLSPGRPRGSRGRAAPGEHHVRRRGVPARRPASPSEGVVV